MTEHETSAEFLTPQEILDRYLATSPRVMFGRIEHDTMRDWHERLSDVDLDNPEQELLAAWLTAEYGFARRFAGEEPSGPDPAQLFDEAADQFEAIAKHESLQVNGLLRGQALVGLGSALVWRDMAQGKNINTVGARYLSLQAQAARHVLAHGATTGSARAAMWADTLTVVMLGSNNTEHEIVFPASPRHISPDVDGFYRSNCILIDRETGIMHTIRVGTHGPDDMLLIPPALLGHGKYASSSGYGTLEVIAGLQDLIDEGASSVDAIRKKQLARFEKLNHHQRDVTLAYGAQIAAQKARTRNVGVIQGEAGLEDPYGWYASLPPSRHPFVVSRNTLDAAISPLEMRFLEDEGLSPIEAMDLAWMYTEVALGRAAQPGSRAQNIRGDIQRGEEIFGHAMERLSTAENSIAFCEASFGFASLALYEAVLCGDEITLEMSGVYCDALAQIGQRAIDRYASLKDKRSHEAQELDTFVQRVTFCLLAHMEGGSEYVALPATPRQQGPGGWDVSIWSQTLSGFIPGRYGRIRVAEKEDRQSLADGIVIVTPHHMGQKMQAKRFATFNALADEFYGAPLPPKTPANQRVKQIAKAWSATLRPIEAAEV